MMKPNGYKERLEEMEGHRREFSAQEICEAFAKSTAEEMNDADSVGEGIIVMMASASITRRAVHKLFPELDKEKEELSNDNRREE